MKKKFKLEGLECANCAAKMEEAMNQLDGVKNASVNFITTKMIIEAQEEKMERIIKEAEEIIKRIEPQVVLKKI
ncbi:cation transporter [Garciella nitratireducens]|uniref:Heavy-metal-associated domain-containing protein n=1 Tax=Garciella nitratireducens DSM 15102 TaxID=1121911 RepID=A0A1T4KQ35_9FIRM|nr:cation transporter [Garciella nitratireducens]SJZ44525.1 Heavy-metal-associated domain-containing protein [Garciella nitratireducens DSM 15102]